MITGLPMVMRAEMQHVRLKPPRQRIAAADHAVLGNGGDEDDVRHQMDIHTATAALMCGCGS